jgi:large subunit ribosomal protein L5
MSYTKEIYNKIKKELSKELDCKNVMEVPRLSKVILNIGFKVADADNNFLKYVVEQLSLIAGQKAVLTKAKKSIAGFKLREDMPIGCKVTLRGEKMYEFIDRLIYIALPRVRDFRGLSGKNFNQSGHYTFGIKEHNVFPEINLDKAYKNLGLSITVVTTAKKKEGCKLLLKKLNFPIK